MKKNFLSELKGKFLFLAEEMVRKYVVNRTAKAETGPRKQSKDHRSTFYFHDDRAVIRCGPRHLSPLTSKIVRNRSTLRAEEFVDGRSEWEKERGQKNYSTGQVAVRPRQHVRLTKRKNQWDYWIKLWRNAKGKELPGNKFQLLDNSILNQYDELDLYEFPCSHSTSPRRIIESIS